MKNQASQPHNPQSGSIFIWIFVMIALFGALSYAMIQSGRTGTSTVSGEQAKLLTTEILAQAQGMADTIRKLRIDGCTDEQISFVGEPTTGSDYTNALTPADGHCKIFNAGGGGMNWKPPPSSLEDAYWFMMGAHCYEGSGSTGTCSATTTDLELNLVDIPDSLCSEINKSAGIGSGTTIPLENYNASPPNSRFQGTYLGGNSSASRIEGIGASGKRYGCYQDNTGSMLGINIFYYILIAR